MCLSNNFQARQFKTTDIVTTNNIRLERTETFEFEHMAHFIMLELRYYIFIALIKKRNSIAKKVMATAN